MIDERVLKSEEKAVFALRALYGKYGYMPYKMNKFEEYELYMKNKDFLVSDRVITFNDTNGKLLALKPDVTLSIIKNVEYEKGVKHKVYYNENVYRVSGNTKRFKEIMQTGLECIGDIDLYDIYEVITLAAESLSQLSDSFVIEVSDLGILLSVVESTCSDSVFTEKAIKLIENKNEHELVSLCEKYGVDTEKAENLCALIHAYGARKTVLEQIKKICEPMMVERVEALSALLDTCPFSDRIKFDFSIVNNMNYYNGFVMNGFIDGISEAVIAGGQYDKMMKKMGKNCGAFGFALYLDLLEQIHRESRAFDVNVLLLYDEKNSISEIASKVRELSSSGLSVTAQRSVPDGLKFREMIDMRKGDK